MTSQRATIEFDSAGGYELRLNLQEVLSSLDVDAAKRLADSLCIHELLVERIVAMIVDGHCTDDDGEWWSVYTAAIERARRTLSERHSAVYASALKDAEERRRYDIAEAKSAGKWQVLHVVRELWGADDEYRISEVIRKREEASRATPGGV